MSVVRVLGGILKHLLMRFVWHYKGCMIERGVTCIKGVKLGEYVRLCHHSQVCFSDIGARTTVGRYTKIQYAKIGKYCSISWDVTIGALDHPMHSISMHAFVWNKKYGILRKLPPHHIHQEKCIIGNDVWIGCGAIVMPRVKIGDGAIIGAGSVVTHDVKPYEIVAGTPARHVKWRFSEQVRNILQESKWWDWKDEIIHDNIELFSPSINIEERPDITERMKILSTRAL